MIVGQVNSRRNAIIPLELRGFNGQTERMDAMIDNGFDDFVTISPDLASRLQLPFLEMRFYQLGDGNYVEFAAHLAIVVWDGQEREVEALVTDGSVLVGMSMLHGYLLFVNVVDGGEVRIEARPK